MDVDEIINKLAEDTDVFPKEALQHAALKKDEIIPHLIKGIQDASDRKINSRSNLPCLSVLLLSQFQCQESHEALCKLMKIPHEKDNDYLYAILDDLLCENMPSVLANTYNGDMKHIESIIDCEEANVFARGAAMTSLVLLVLTNVIPRDMVINYFETLLKNGMKSYDIVELNSMLIKRCYQLQAKELLPLIKLKYDEGLVDKREVPFDQNMPRPSKWWYDMKINCTRDTIEILHYWADAKTEVVKPALPKNAAKLVNSNHTVMVVNHGDSYNNIPKNKRKKKKKNRVARSIQ